MNGRTLVNEPSQEAVWASMAAGSLSVMSVGTKAQPVLQKKGDDLRIDWGATSTLRRRRRTQPRRRLRRCRLSRKAWLGRGTAAAPAIPLKPLAVADDAPVMAVAMNFGRIEKEPTSRWLIWRYDDLYSIQYFGKNLRPYWRRTGMMATESLAVSARENRLAPDALH